MLKIINFFRGNVRVELNSEFPERFINVCAQNGIPLWDIDRSGTSTLTASMHRNGYAKVRAFTSRGVGQVRIIGNRGLPHFLRRFRRRYALLLSILVMSAGLFALSLFIWDMNVYGNEKIPKERIMRELGELGVGIGTLRRNIDSKELQNRMILRIPELEWLAVNVKGSRASVEVREKEPKPDIVARDVPCNIVARKAGLITSINTLEGAAAVTVGQAVEEGQLLVSGLVNSNIIGMRQVHAMAEVTARTWYEYTSVIPSHATGKNYTGREKKRGAIVLAGRRFNLYWGKSETVNADKTVDRKTLSIGGSFTLPLVWVVETLTEYEPTQYKISYDSADAYMKYSLGLRLNDESEGGEVLSVSSLTTELDMVYQCEMTAECLESVAVTVIMP